MGVGHPHHAVKCEVVEGKSLPLPLCDESFVLPEEHRMSGKKKRRAKKRREQTGRQKRPATRAEDIYRYGPLEMRHSGRNVTLSAKWKPGEYKRHVSETIAERPVRKSASTRR